MGLTGRAESPARLVGAPGKCGICMTAQRDHTRKLHRLRSFLEHTGADPTVSLSADFTRKHCHHHRSRPHDATSPPSPDLQKPPKTHRHKHRHREPDPVTTKTIPTKLTVGKHVITVDSVTPPPRSDEKSEKFDPRHAILAQVQDLIELAETAKEQYRDLPDGENAMALTALLREMRGLTGDFVSMGNDDLNDLLRKLHQTVLAPVFRRVVGTVIKEHRSLRRQLSLALGEQHAPVIDREIRASLKNYGPRLQAEYELVVQRAAEQLGVGEVIQPLLDRIDLALTKKVHK